MSFPIVLKTPEGDSAEEQAVQSSKLYYRVASNGVFQVRELATHRSVTKVTSAVPGLAEERERVELRVPRLPRELLEEVLEFFAEVYRRYRGEAIVILFYDAAKHEFRVGVPPQQIRVYADYWGRWWPDHHLHYQTMERPQGFVRFGTIHSHADLQAYASHTDCEDERYEDGLHVIFGSFKSGVLSRSASFVAGGRRFDLEPDQVLEPCEVPDREAKRSWMEQVEYVEDRWKPYTSTSTVEPVVKGNGEVRHG
jgi:hypothetical protein